MLQNVVNNDILGYVYAYIYVYVYIHKLPIQCTAAVTGTYEVCICI